MEGIVNVSNLKKTYKILNRREGLAGAFRDLFSRNYSSIDAVDNLSFQIQKGEIVGFLGPNGAGKSTTIKMLTGVLKPTEGICKIDGYDPFKQRKKYVKEIGVVMGQRTQLWWDLPVIESYKLLREIYDIPKAVYQENLQIFEELLGLQKLYMKPVRNLSLGQRMLCDIAASFLHNPKIIFLDEPTIGLDVSIKYNIRKLIKELNKVRNTTIVLTSHDVGDIESLSDRIILINEGKLYFDGTTIEFGKSFSNSRTIKFQILDAKKNPESKIIQLLDSYSANVNKKYVLSSENDEWYSCTINIDEYDVTALVEALLRNLMIKDITIESISMEMIIKQMYEGAKM